MGQETESPLSAAKSSEDGMTFGNTQINGFRTYSIIFMVMAVYCYLALKGGNVEPMQDLAFMICGYLFGAKVVRR